MNLKNKSIMVTGGAGFIGSHLVDQLISEEPERIVVVDNFFLGKQRNLKGTSRRLRSATLASRSSTRMRRTTRA